MYPFVKRAMDIVGAIVLLVVAAPLLILIAIAIKLDGGPAIFAQDRVGLHGQIFKIFKFRSMIVDADKFLDENNMPTRSRITRVGSILRKTSMDELPQLLNILKGDVSFIGPRPILPSMLPFLTARERIRFDIRPGVTGLAQIKGRNNLRWSRRLRYDGFYKKNLSLKLDIFVFVQTLVVLLTARDVAVDRNANVVDDLTIRNIEGLKE